MNQSGNDECKGTWRDDWRIMGQEGYLKGKELVYQVFDRSICIEDFDQCEFCWKVFDRDKKKPNKAYYCPSEKVWICEKCFTDFQKYFNWKIVANNEDIFIKNEEEV